MKRSQIRCKMPTNENDICKTGAKWVQTAPKLAQDAIRQLLNRCGILEKGQKWLETENEMVQNAMKWARMAKVFFM